MILGRRTKEAPREGRQPKPRRPSRPRAVETALPLTPLVPGQYEISPDLVVVSAPQTPAALTLAEAAAALITRHVDKGRRGVALCGASKGVGVTFVTANLAAALAQSGVSTIVVDCNLRSPGLEQFLRPASSVPGVREYLGHASYGVEDVVHNDVLPNLSVIYAGESAADAQALLSSERLRTLLGDCLRNYECTLVDTSPANLGSDAMIVSAILTYAAIVARRGTSYVDDVELLRSQLVTDGAEVIGSILNSV